ncbi:MAG: SpoIID/LytB domain-containing protein [Armatimonadota bacterium]
MKHMQYAIICLIIIIAPLLIKANASAQNILPDTRITIELENTPVTSATAQILKDTGLKFVIDKSITYPVNLKLYDVPLSDALMALLKSVSASGRIDNGTFYMCPMPRQINFRASNEMPGMPYTGQSVTRDDTGKVIRVGLIHTVGKSSSYTIASSGSADIIDSATNQIISDISNAQTTLTKSGDSIDVTIIGRSLGQFKGPIRIQPSSGLNALEILSPKVKSARYSGILEIIGGETLTLVNELPLDDYVRGVLPVEVPASFSPEAQKALTLAIRTYALKSTKRHAASGFSLCDSTDCQGFSGASREAEWVDRLIDQTRGQIIVHNDDPIYALYSTDCGGTTQSNEDAGISTKPWPYLRSVVDSSVESPDDFCASSPCHKWRKLLTADDLNKTFSKYKAYKLGAFKSMEFALFDSSQRVKTVIVQFENGESKLTGARFREIFGLSVIKSTKMTLTTNTDGSYLVEGKGYGHGLGMCAFGANGMAKSSPAVTYIDILRHYYTGVDIKRLNTDGSTEAVSSPINEPTVVKEPEKPKPVTPAAIPGPVIETPKPQVPAAVEKPVISSPPSGPPILAGRTAAIKKK